MCCVKIAGKYVATAEHSHCYFSEQFNFQDIAQNYSKDYCEQRSEAYQEADTSYLKDELFIFYVTYHR